MAGKFLSLRLAGQKWTGGKRICALGSAIAIFSTIYMFPAWAPADVSPATVHRPTKSSQAHARHKKHKPDPPLITEAAPSPAPPPSPPPKLTPEQMPPRTPEITWDGKLLSINAENSTLSDILVAVRTRTGAAIDMPPGATSERMAARLGPAPIREVLTSLLSSTNFDYIIQASETNDDEIARLILTPRGKDDALANTSVSAANSGGIRRGPGYTASGKHTFEVSPDTPAGGPGTTDVATAEGESGEPASTPSDDSAATAMRSPADSTAGSDANSTADAAQANSDAQPALPGAPADSSSARTTNVGEMVQNMQQMFEQRRQIQLQQNQAVRSQSTTPNN